MVTRSLDEQHLPIRGQRPNVVGDHGFELVGDLAQRGQCRENVLAGVLGIGAAGTIGAYLIAVVGAVVLIGILKALGVFK